ncbi:MAG: protein-L-isoaspartate(D-aspartate) O-methyltransferase [Anaerolineaceae bacterium]|nr:protein-L-isoaspartate(D-aspartate) O-methyltransferase [Anaerolineaceae bacterium]
MKFRAILASLVCLTYISSCAQTPDTPKMISPAPTLTAENRAQTADRYVHQREEMVQHSIIDWGINNQAVIEAMRSVPRHEFVPAMYLSEAYANHPLPIGHGQTISQPYIVALMTEAVEVQPHHRVLEIGAGSGYQAAILAELAAQVYTIEIIEPLATRAKETLERLGYDNVIVRHADGYYGWDEAAPFDAIVVTAAPDHIPQPLIEQLKLGGRMIIPVGPVAGVQTLWLLTRNSEKEVVTKNLGYVRFVPFTRLDE